MLITTAARTTAATLLAAILILPALGAQTFEGRTDVIDIQVPVNVVFPDGTPVRDLTIEDFTILDKGKEQEITGFEVVDLAVLEPVETRGQALAEAVPAAARRHFLLLFDLSFASPASVLKARQAAREFVLEGLHPTDLVGVATYSIEYGPRLVVTFTPDRAQLARAIETLGAQAGLDRAVRRDPLRFIIGALGGGAASSGTLGSDDSTSSFRADIDMQVLDHFTVLATEMSRQERAFERGRVSSWTRGLQEMARALGSVKGRKHVVYFSEGFDGRLMLGRGPDANDPEINRTQDYLNTGQYWMVDMDQVYGNSTLQMDAHDMLQEFRRADCVIQAVDISGLRADSAEEARGREMGDDVLFYMANETGGDFFDDANDLGRQLTEVLERTTVTYLLSFQPRDLEADGSYHKLRVEVDAPRRVRVAHRVGYYAPRPFEDLHPLEKTLLTSDAIAAAEPRRDLEVRLLAAPFRASLEEAYVPVIIEVNGRSLLDGHRDKSLPVEVFTYVSNDKGEMTDFFTQMVTLDVARGRESLERSGLKYYGHLNMEPGRYLVRVLVRNARTGRTGVETVEVEVPDYQRGEPDLLPPFFLEAPGKWLLVREQEQVQQRSVIYPFTVNGTPFIPAARPILDDSDEADLCLVVYNLGEGDLVLQGTVMTVDGEEVKAGDLDLVERTVTGIPGLDKLLATFRPAGLARGEYTLQVAVTDPGSGMSQVNSIPFEVD